jgi:PPOX class probable F420-dependent enzyme
MAALPLDTHGDLLGAPGIAILSTITPAGAIQSTALWYLVDGGELKISLSDARKKLRNLQGNPNATFFLLDPANPFRFVEIRATVTIEPDTDFAFRSKVGAQYGADIASFDKPGDQRFVVTLHPTTVNAQ